MQVISIRAGTRIPFLKYRIRRITVSSTALRSGTGTTPEYYGNYGNGDYYGRRNQRVAYNYDHRGFGYMGGFGYAHGFFGRAFYDYGFGW